MAHVVMTQELQRLVLNNCERMFEKRITEASVFFMDKQEAGELVLAAVIKPFQESWDSIPVSWRYVDDDIYFGSINSFKPVKGNICTLPLKCNKPIPYFLKSWNSSNIVSEELNEFVEKWKTHNQGIEQIVSERDEFKVKVKKFMFRHNSLGQALKEWPQFQELVPKEYMERFNRKVEKAKASDKPALDLDLAELNGAIVVSKIVEG